MSFGAGILKRGAEPPLHDDPGREENARRQWETD
jgi:hypothetical protein